VTIVTLPLVAYYFNQISWMGLLVNFLVVPFTGLVLVPLGLGCALWLLATQASVLPLAGLIHLFSAALIDGVRTVAGLPGVLLYVAAPTIPLMCAFYGSTWIGLTRSVSFYTRVGAMLAMGVIIVWGSGRRVRSPVITWYG
jgi:competence protein ComEC